MKNRWWILIGCAVLMLEFSCTEEEHKYQGHQENDSRQQAYLISEDSSIAISTGKDSTLIRAYRRAIADYVKKVSETNKIRLDTLYLLDRKMGTPDDFPDIKLPERISGVIIQLIAFDVAHGEKLKVFKNTSPAVNLIGWVDATHAEFTFVTFFPEFVHQYDCYLNYNYVSTKGDFELVNYKMEMVKNDHTGKAHHFEVYENGQYVGTRSLNAN